MAPTPENAPSWHKMQRHREICLPAPAHPRQEWHWEASSTKGLGMRMQCSLLPTLSCCAFLPMFYCPDAPVPSFSATS